MYMYVCIYIVTESLSSMKVQCKWLMSACLVVFMVATDLSLRSDVYVGTISRIEITTRTRELLLKEEPEKFEVRAFDDEGEIRKVCYVCGSVIIHSISLFLPPFLSLSL